jgi:hypothetical protein
MTNSPPSSFSFKSPDYYEQLQIELAGMASDLRMLGFNEPTIHNWVKKMWDIQNRKDMKVLIENCKKLQAEYAIAEDKLIKLKRKAKRLKIKI